MPLGERFDAIVVGAGPSGCAAALAQARRGRDVLLLEANPNAADRLAGEWLHPRAVDALAGLGVALPDEDGIHAGAGFVVHPDDGSPPVTLPYVGGRRGWSGEHRMLVDHLRAAADEHPRITLRSRTRVRRIERGRVFVRHQDRARPQAHEATTGDRGPLRVISAPLVIGADGRSSVARRTLGLAPDTTAVSRMAGLRLSDCELPTPAHGHVFLGGPGPVLAYRITARSVRICIDVPHGVPADTATIGDLYARALPDTLHEAFERALAENGIQWASNLTRPRRHYGRPDLRLIGDAAGFSHPLTAVGMTLGITDAVTLAEEASFDRWVAERRRNTRVPELLASVLYDVFRSDAETAGAIRRRIEHVWRHHPRERVRTMGHLAAETPSTKAFAGSFLRVAAPATLQLVGAACAQREPGRAGRRLQELGRFAGWLARATVSGRTDAPPRFQGETPLCASRLEAAPDARTALRRASSALLALQGAAPPRGPEAQRREREGGPADGSRRGARDSGGGAAGFGGGWEGEVVWCGLLAAQYTIFCHLAGVAIPPERRARLLLQLERTRDRSGLWGLHPLSPPYLFTTTLAYIAARLLGADADGTLLARAHAFIVREGVERIPSWGKLWLAMLGLYDWRGVPPILPELFALPESWPIHPSKFYCHTRHIYMAMSVLVARKPVAGPHPTLDALREELWPGGMEGVDWSRARRSLRRAERATPPGLALRLAYEAGALYESFHPPQLRAHLVEDLEDAIRWELDATGHTCLSPVSGMLGLLALHASPRPQPDWKRGLEGLEAWIFEDDVEGTRIAGARSASWDTAFALQALAATARALQPGAAHAQADRDFEPPSAPSIAPSIADAETFLLQQQIRHTPEGFASAHRIDPRGGFCFAHGWHGWPVSDCTAEAVEALLAAHSAGGSGDTSAERRKRLDEAVRFMLRCRNRDGGFGSYEARRSRIGLEWLNPAEMFGDSMTEHSYVECTASCLSSLRHALGHVSPALEPAMIDAAARAEHWLRRHQRSDGSWPGVWGVGLVYGTTFGVRGLVAAGARPSDPALRRAARFLLERQRTDGGWSESHTACLDGRWRDGDESQVIQTAWALLALLEAGCADWAAVTRAARFLIERLPDDGRWPRQWPAGVFFRTALLEYDLYRQVFPLWALAIYEERRQTRERLDAQPREVRRGRWSEDCASPDPGRRVP